MPGQRHQRISRTKCSACRKVMYVCHRKLIQGCGAPMYSPREARKDFLYTKLVALLLFSLMGAGFAVWGFQQGVEYGLITLSPRQAQGRIIEVGEQERSIKVTFEYHDTDLVKHLGDVRKRKKFALQLDAGDDVSVLYFSLYPAIAQLEMQLSKQAISFYILLGCFCFHLVAGFLIMRTIGQIRQHASEDFYY